MIDPPESAGYKVGLDYVNAVVTSGHHEATYSSQTDQPGHPVEDHIPGG